MPARKQEVVSAQVLLRSATGKVIKSDSVITAETIKDFAPSPETVTKARRAFAAAGFEIGPTVGISFSITASVRQFDQLFEITLKLPSNGRVEVVKNNVSMGYELPLDGLPRSISDLVVAVTFTPPTDFGPCEFLGS